MKLNVIYKQNPIQIFLFLFYFNGFNVLTIHLSESKDSVIMYLVYSLNVGSIFKQIFPLFEPKLHRIYWIYSNPIYFTISLSLQTNLWVYCTVAHWLSGRLLLKECAYKLLKERRLIAWREPNQLVSRWCEKCHTTSLSVKKCTTPTAKHNQVIISNPKTNLAIYITLWEGIQCHNSSY